MLGRKGHARTVGSEVLDDGAIFDDDLIKGNGVPWFGMAMTREEKIEGRRLRCNNMIVKKIGRSVGFHYLWRRIQTMWRTRVEPL